MSKGWYPVIDYDKCVGCMAGLQRYMQAWRLQAQF